MPTLSPLSPRGPARRARLARLANRRLSALDGRIPRRRTGANRGRSAVAARAGGQTVGGALPGGRVTRGIGAVVLLALVGLGVRGLFGQRLNIAGQLERAARAKYIPQLEKQLGQKVEVGDFETDLLGRVTVRDIVVGRNSQLPTGALLRAKSLTVGLDIIGLALGQREPLDAVNAVTIESPQVYVERAPNGKFNLESLLPKTKSEQKTTWTGVVTVHDGRAFYFDRALPSRSGRRLKIDARGIEATVRANGEAPYQAQVTLGQTILPDGSVAKAIRADATLSLEPRRGWISAQFPALPAAVLTDYALPKGEAIARRGTVSGAIQVAVDGKNLVPRGDVNLSGIGLVAGKVREPLGGQANAGAPLALDDLSGPVRFSNRALQSSGLSARALGASWKASGALAIAPRLGSSRFDVQLATPNLPVSRLLKWAPPGAAPVSWQSGNVGLSARASGSPNDARLSGALDAPDVRLRSNGLPNGLRDARFDAQLSEVTASFAAQIKSGAPVKFAARARVPRLSANGAAAGYAGAGKLSELQISARGGAGPNSPLEVNARAANWQASSPRYGGSRGQSLSLVAATGALGRPDWQGQLKLREGDLSGINLGAIAPAAARLVRDVGTASASVTFAGVGRDLKNARADADLTLSRVSLSPQALPAQLRASVPASALTLRDLRARVALRNGRIVVPGAGAASGLGALRVGSAGGGFAVELPDVRLSAAQINPFLRAQNARVSGDWRGRIALSGTSASAFDATFALSSAAATVNTTRGAALSARLDAPQLRGSLSARPGGDYRGEATLSARLARVRDASGASGSGGSARLDGPTARASFAIGRGGALSGRAVASARAASVSEGKLGPLTLPNPLDGARASALSARADFAAGNARAQLTVGAIALPINGARAVGVSARANYAGGAWVARLSATRAAAPVPNGAPGAVATVRDISALAQSEGRTVRINRLSAAFAGGRVDGTGRLANGQLTARALAREVDAGALQRLFAAQTLAQARLSGQLGALVSVENGGAPRVEAQLARGSVTVTQSGAVVPLDEARARLVLQGRTLLLREATLWSDGARISGAGQIDLARPAPGALPAASGTLRVDALRLASWATRLQQLGVAGLEQKGWQQAALDGIVSGDFQLSGGARPRVEGTLELRAGTAFGADIQSSSARLSAVNVSGAPGANGGWRVAVADWTGRIEGAPFEGAINLDTAANTWRVRLKTDDLDAGRAARLRALSARSAASEQLDLLPIEGDLSADVDVSGVLRPEAQNAQPFFVPRAGYARLVGRDLELQGRSVGTLRANLEVDGTLARIQTLELVPSTRPQPGAAPTPRLSASGTIPLAPDAPGLDVSFELGETPLQFFADAARDTRDLLSGTGSGSGVTQSALDQVVQYADALPPGTRGEVAVRASIGGTLRRPTFSVPSLTLRDGRTPLPFGGFSPPATLDAAFSYGNGIATISQGEFRLQKTEEQRAENANDDDALLRIEPGASIDLGGQIDLAADVFNANLSQLATWVPALRGANGAPVTRGDVTEFSLRLSGPTRAPDVIGSVQGEDLKFRDYALDRVRVARFEISDGQLRVEPGNFTVAKGAYQSSAASGAIGWDWRRGGPILDGPINVNFPVETRDFAALAGLFVPALSEVGAEELSGGVQVGGTLKSPKLSGRVTLRDARFKLDGPRVAAPLGLKNVSGTLRFTPDQRIEIDADDPLRGTLASAASIQAKTVVAPAKNSARVPRETTTPLALAGDWKLRGAIGLDLSAEALSNPARAVARQKYDLAFSLDGGALSSPQLAGLRDGDAALRFFTDAEGAQRLRWMIAARGRRKNNQNRGGGQLVSIGSLRLRPDFATGTEALLRSSAEPFGAADDFAAFAVAKRVNLESLPDRRPQIALDDFEWSYTGVGSGEVAGRLVLDNRDAIQQAPAAAERLREASVRNSLSAAVRARRVSANDSPGGLLSAAQMRAAQTRPIQFEGADTVNPNPDEPLRVGGQLTLQNATIVGAPSGGAGAATRLSLLPAAPRFDVRLVLGEKVEFVTSAFRTGLEGELVASGVPSNPQLLGTVETRNGQVRFPNARARVSQGRVTVAITRDPTTDLLRTRADIDASATGRAGNYQITLALNGPLDLSGNGQNLSNLRVDVTSNPPLSQSEAFAQLLGTAPSTNNGTFTSNDANQAYAGAVLQVLSAPLFSGVERSVAQALGLDSVSFEYRFNEPLSVQFSKAVSDRVFVTYRRTFGPSSATGGGGITAGRTPFELSIEYQIKGNVRLGLRTDESRITTLTLGQTFRF